MSRLSLSPRAAIVIAVVVLVVAVVVAVVASRRSGDGTVATVTGAPAVTAEGDATGASSPASTGSSSGAATPGAASVVVVHVIGAVEQPGLVELPSGARVADAVRAVGGVAGDADVSRVNLARVVGDGERVWIPRTGEPEPPDAVDAASGGSAPSGGTAPSGGGSAGTGAGSPSGSGAAAELVDLNTADSTALQTLPGIGPAMAERILTWRQQNGSFASVDQLMDVNGIGEKRLADLRDLVRV